MCHPRSPIAGEDLDLVSHRRPPRMGALAVPHVYATLGTLGVGLLALGGLLYSIGALAYAMQWPNPAPRVFGYHEIFHALVILAAAAHFALVATAVV